MRQQPKHNTEQGETTMPLKKSASKAANNERRLDNYHSREKAKEYFGEAAVKGKQVHHRDGSQKNNAKSNLKLTTAKEHGAMHGSGNGKRGTGKIKNNGTKSGNKKSK